VITSGYANSGYCNGARACTTGPAVGYLYFGGRLLSEPNGAVLADRLGSQRNGMSYYPWGEEKTSTPDGQVKFGTYFRDMPGQDYADQRYYTATAGRFYTPDPSRGVNLRDPGTWNKYTYANDDPVNRYDPSGLDSCDPNATCVEVTGTYDSVTNIFLSTNTALSAGTNGPPNLVLLWNAAVKHAQAMAKLLKAETLAEIILKNDQDCANLFGQGTTVNGAMIDAAQVLQNLYAGKSYGSITVGDIASKPGTVTSATTTPGIIQTGGSTQNAAYIVINDLAGSYVTGTFESQVVTLLHELGHAVNDIFGPGTSLIQPDGQSVKNGVQISMDNTALVDNVCFKNYTGPGAILLP